MSPVSTPTANTRLIALLGDPVSHSLSPRVQNAAIRAQGIDAIYVALRCNSADCERLVLGIARAGGGGNVTVPHKEQVANLVEQPSEVVSRIGACNTFWLEKEKLCGDNTDVVGLRQTIADLVGKLTRARVAIIGAGGSARAAIAVLSEAQVDRIDVVSRNPDRIGSLQAIAHGTATSVAAAALPLAHAYDLVINTTPLGLQEHDALPVPIEQLRGVSAVLDLVYGRNGTAWTTAAAAAGIPARDGKDMLLYQAAASFERWFQRPAPIEVMRAGLENG